VIVPNLGFSELIVILMILLLVFGASRLPQIGESLGRTIRGVKRGLASDDKIEVAATSQVAPSKQDKRVAPGGAGIEDAELVDRKADQKR
jgi:sec-independent protein translocase protein TatA